ncbi:MAG: PAS domain-containing protein [Firmicutes bacterium]|nr:PAS domain-containing protein [Bacillota bacterium]
MAARKKDLLALIVMLVVITGLHYFTAHYRLQLHEFYRRLYYVPIIYAAFRFRFQGGLVTSLIVALLYAPHLLLYVGALDLAALNQVMEIILFMTIGVITGVLVEHQHRHQHMVTRQLEQITALENYTHNILESMVTGVAAFDPELRLMRVNQRLTELLGWDESACGQRAEHLATGLGDLPDRLQAVLKTGHAISGLETEYSHPDKEEEALPLRLHILPLRSVEQKIIGVLLVAEDMRDIRDLERQVRRADRLAATGVLAAGIAHEIRNPLGIIKTIAQTMRSKRQVDGVEKEGLAIIEAEVNRASGVIGELMDFARPVPNTSAIFNFSALAEEVVTLTERYAAQNKIELLLSGDADLKVDGDREKLKQALVNLIFNAIEAQPDGGTVVLRLERTKEGVGVSVADAGPGVAPGNRERIFDPFYTTREQGTGLGLTLVHRIVTDHGGTLEVGDSPEGGAMFTIKLPGGDGDGDDSRN